MNILSDLHGVSAALHGISPSRLFIIITHTGQWCGGITLRLKAEWTEKERERSTERWEHREDHKSAPGVFCSRNSRLPIWVYNIIWPWGQEKGEGRSERWRKRTKKEIGVGEGGVKFPFGFLRRRFHRCKQCRGRSPPRGAPKREIGKQREWNQPQLPGICTEHFWFW